jgi:hypothetical protein
MAKYSLQTRSCYKGNRGARTFVHYPINLAWALRFTRAKLTDKAAIDVSQVFYAGTSIFCSFTIRSLEGLILLSPLRMNGISNDQDVMDYAK